MTANELIAELQRYTFGERGEEIVLYEPIDNPNRPYGIHEVKYNSSDGTLRLR